MSPDLSAYMLKVTKGDKESFRFIANSLGYKMHATAIKILGLSHYLLIPIQALRKIVLLRRVSDFKRSIRMEMDFSLKAR